MENRTKLIAAIREADLSQVPCDIQLSPAQLEEYQKRHPDIPWEQYFGLYHRTAALRLEQSSPASSFFDDPAVRTDAYGVGMSGGSAEAYHMVRFHSPLAGSDISVSQIEDFPLPDIPDDAEDEMHKFCRDMHAGGLAAAAVMEQTIWERAWLIRSLEDLMSDMICDPEKASMLLDRLTDHACRMAKMYAEAGFDIIKLGDDIGMQHAPMMSTEMWRSWLKPRLQQVTEAAKHAAPEILVSYHSCGYIEPFIPDFIELGIDILNPLQPESMDIEAVIKTYGSRISFWGGIGTQSVLPFGTSEEVRREVHRLWNLCRGSAGLVISPSHMVEPEVPWENIEAFRSAILELRDNSL